MSASMSMALFWIDRPTPAQPAVSTAEVEEARAPTLAAPQPDDPGKPQPAQSIASPHSATVSRGVPQAVAPRIRPPSPSPAAEVHPTRTPAVRPTRRPRPVENAAVAPEEPRPRAEPKVTAPPRTDQGRAPTAAGMITPSMLRRLSSSLNLTPEQRALYQPLERALLAIGSQQAALLRTGQDPKDAFSLGTAMSMYGVAQPFLGALREEQKTRLRAEARSLGFGFAAEQI